ncbi:ATP/GTP-binding protein [Flavobacterium sp.]|uniref:AAA family ATPase n=1 Tax=Flavobacterium sp. TaxID=239 RepID=UPI0035B40D6F
MKNNHLTYFKVENFKKFNSLEVNDIGQFNLIVGDNNVGKTCLLEAMVLDLEPKNMISYLHHIFHKRNIFINSNVSFPINKEEFNFKNNLIGLCQKNKELPIRFTRILDSKNVISNQVENLTDFNPINNDETKQFINNVGLYNYNGINQLSKNWLIFKKTTNNFESVKNLEYEIDFVCDITSKYYKDFYFNADYVPLIRINDIYEVVYFYKEIIKSPEDEDRVIKILRKIFKEIEIERFSISDNFNQELLNVSTKKKKEYHPVNEYGDGFMRILTILFELLYNENKSFYIDEIEVGIHHSKLKNFWVNILQICNELNVQLFTTTHSLECIKAFADASKEFEEKYKFKLIKLKENNDTIKSISYPYEEFEYLINNETEIR